MKKTVTVMVAVLTMLACAGCMDRTKNETQYQEDYGEVTPKTVSGLDYLG